MAPARTRPAPALVLAGVLALAATLAQPAAAQRWRRTCTSPAYVPARSSGCLCATGYGTHVSANAALPAGWISSPKGTPLASCSRAYPAAPDRKYAECNKCTACPPMFDTDGALEPNKAQCQPQDGLALFDAWLIVEGTVCDNALGASLKDAVVSALAAAGAVAPQATMLACKVPLRNQQQAAASTDPAERNSEYAIRFASASVNASLAVADKLNEAADACSVLKCGPAVVLAKGVARIDGGDGVCPAGAQWVASDKIRPRRPSGRCVQCTGNQYNPTTGGSCKPCRNMTEPAASRARCLELLCRSGTQDDGVGGCTKCINNTFNDMPGKPCRACPADKVPAANRTSCVSCPACMRPNSRGDVCECSPGCYGNATACGPCNAGTFAPAPAASTCAKCADNTYSLVRAANCTACPVGSSAVGNATNCACNTGRYTDGAVPALSCPLCKAGTYSNSTGATACDACGTDTYSYVGEAQCTTCPAGSVAGASAPYCNCTAGQFWNNATRACEQCGVNQYSHAAGATACTPCPPGSTNTSDNTACGCKGGYSSDFQPGPGGGVLSCTSCNPGEYSNAGDTSCSQCGNNQYSLGAAPNCTNCPVGATSKTSDADRSRCTCQPSYAGDGRSCSPCDGAMQYAGEAGLAVCKTCSAPFGPNGAHTACTGCSQGNQPSGGTCQPCSAGTAGLDGSTCTACTAPGEYSPVDGLSSCAKCTNCDTTGSGALGGKTSASCLPGYGASGKAEKGTLACTRCAPGTYSAGGGAACTAARLDYYTEYAGAAAALACPNDPTFPKSIGRGPSEESSTSCVCDRCNACVGPDGSLPGSFSNGTLTCPLWREPTPKLLNASGYCRETVDDYETIGYPACNNITGCLALCMPQYCKADRTNLHTGVPMTVVLYKSLKAGTSEAQTLCFCKRGDLGTTCATQVSDPAYEAWHYGCSPAP